MPVTNTPPTLSPQAAIIMMLVWLLIMGGIIVSYVIMLIAFWKGMRAHQKIAKALEAIAEKLALK